MRAFSTLSVALFISIAPAQAHQTRGFIQSSDGEKCWFNQSVNETASPFPSKSPKTAQVVTLQFDSETCMPLNQINVKQIAWRVAKPYSHDDANFSMDLKWGSKMGGIDETICVQSQTYPMAGVLFGYITKDKYITGAVHHTAVAGCKPIAANLNNIPLY